MFNHKIRQSFLVLGCAFGLATMSGPTALAVTAHDALCVAELITAGCRATTLVAQHLEASGSKNANTAHAIAYAVQAANELLALINHMDDPVRAVGYSGSWLVYDLYQLADRLSDADPEVKASAATDGGKQGADGATAPAPTSEPSTAVEPLTDGSCERDTDLLLLRNLLLALEPVIAVGAAYLGWQGTPNEKQAGRILFQWELSMLRTLRLFFDHRDKPEEQYYRAALVMVALLFMVECVMIIRAAPQPDLDRIFREDAANEARAEEVAQQAYRAKTPQQRVQEAQHGLQRAQADAQEARDRVLANPGKHELEMARDAQRNLRGWQRIVQMVQQSARSPNASTIVWSTTNPV